MMRKISLLALLALATLLAGCSDQEKGQVILTVAAINPTSDPFGDTRSGSGSIFGDTVDIEMHNDLKNPAGLGSTTWANVNIESITVSFVRVDGGSDKPATFRTAVSCMVPANGVFTIENFEIVPATLKTKFPISDLLFYGYERSTNFTSIRCDVILEFEAKSFEGYRVYAKGQVTIEFTDWAD